MGKKRRISVRKVLQALVTLVVAAACIAGISIASDKQDQTGIRHLLFRVTNEQQYSFLDKNSLLNQVRRSHHLAEGKTQVADLDLKAIEEEISDHPWVQHAAVYLDKHKDLHMEVVQRIPVARVFYENGQSYYLDTALNLLPVSDAFSYYTTIVTNVPWLIQDSANRAVRAAVIRMVRFVDTDSFWRAQIAQISMTPDGDFELYPVLGSHKIRLGDTARLENKFQALWSFYRQVLNRIGWDKYEVLDLRFAGQVVALPALARAAPQKNGLSNMTWLKSVIEEESVVVKEKPAVTNEKSAFVKPDQTAAAAPAKKLKEGSKEPPKEVRDANTGSRNGQTSHQGKEAPKPKYLYQKKNNH